MRETEEFFFPPIEMIEIFVGQPMWLGDFILVFYSTEDAFTHEVQ